MILDSRYNYPPEFYTNSHYALTAALDTAKAYERWRILDLGDFAPLEARYDALPYLNKEIMREHFPLGLVPHYRDLDEGLLRGEIDFTFTSGATGDRVVNIWDQNWWDRSEAASWKLNAHLAPLSYPQKEAMLASSLNVGVNCEEDLPVSARTAGNKLYLNEKTSTIQWQPRHLARMAKELIDFEPVLLTANPSLLARLAFWAMDEGVALYSPLAILFTYEFSSLIHLKAIRKVFSSTLISSYGTTETGFVLEECEKGLLHQNIDYCRIDFYPLKDRYGGPELGRIAVTTFGNPWNSILKFDTGDLVRLHPSADCPCGRNQGMIVQALEGRTTNASFTTAGDMVTTLALDKALASIPGIRDYQMEQHSAADYELKIMADTGNRNNPVTDRELLGAAQETMRRLYGRDGQFHIDLVSAILPGSAGKFRRSQVHFNVDWEGLFV